MEPDNSQFSEVPSEEAAAAATPKPKKARKSRATAAPVNIAAPAEEESGPEIGGWAEALVRKGSKNPADKAVAEAAKLEKYYHANKRRYGVPSGTAAVEDEGELPKASPETEHKIGSHGPLTGGPASLEDLMSLSRTDAAKLHENSDECATCAENHKTYVTDALPALHENGAHDDTPGSKTLGDNMHPECEGCQNKIQSLALEHKKGKHTKFGLGARLGFARSGCVQCETAHDSKVAEEHTAGEHAGGVENRRPSCKACQEVQAKEDEANATNAGLKGIIAAARVKRKADLRQTAITGKYPPVEAPAVTTGSPMPGGLLATRTPGKPGTKYERVPHYIDDPSILTEASEYWKAYNKKRGEEKAADQAMWDDYLPNRPNYHGFALPSVEAKNPTEKRTGSTAGATEEELADYHGDVTTKGTREYIPEDLRSGFKAPEVIPSRSQQRNQKLSAVASAVSDFHATHNAYMADNSIDDRHAETMQAKHRAIHTAMTSAGLNNVLESFKSRPGVLHHLAEHPLLNQQAGSKVKDALSSHFASTGDEEGIDRLYGQHELPYSKQGGYNARVNPHVPTPKPEVGSLVGNRTYTNLGLTPINHEESPQPEATPEPSAEQKMWNDYLPGMPNKVGYSTKGILNCSNCGKMISPVAGAVNPVTGQAPEATCRGCRREAAYAARDKGL